MKTLSATPRPYDRWKAEDLSFLHVLLVWWVALTSLLIKKRQSWTIHQKPDLPKILGIRPYRDSKSEKNLDPNLDHKKSGSVGRPTNPDLEQKNKK